jgi:hypothetical protein
MEKAGLPLLSKNRKVVGATEEGPKEIPIAARSKGTFASHSHFQFRSWSCCLYSTIVHECIHFNLLRTIGLNAKNGKRAPAYSFGTKIDFDYSERKCNHSS